AVGIANLLAQHHLDVREVHTLHDVAHDGRRGLVEIVREAEHARRGLAHGRAAALQEARLGFDVPAPVADFDPALASVEVLLKGLTFGDARKLDKCITRHDSLLKKFSVNEKPKNQPFFSEGSLETRR